MKKNCRFEMNLAYQIGITLLCLGTILRHVLEAEGILLNVSEFVSGAGVGLALVGLLHGSAKTRPLFDRFCAFKQQLLGHE